MNPRQRMGVGFLAIAIVGAVAVFFGVVTYVNDVESQVGDRVPAYVAGRDLDPYQPLRPGDFAEVEIPERWLPEGAVQNLNDLTGQVAAGRLTEGTLLQQANLVPRPSLANGQREIAIMIDAETGVAGKIGPGDRVDIWATFSSEVTGVGPRAKVIAENLLVIDVGVQQSRERPSPEGGFSESAAVPITFATDENQVKRLAFAESFALQTRAVLRPPADESLVPPDRKTYVETFGRD